MVDKNITFFNENTTYHKRVQTLDTYLTMRRLLEAEIKGANTLMDIGNGGFFNYDIQEFREVVALDLFLDETKNYGPNVIPICGNALDFNIGKKFDVIVVQMLIHHLAGKSPEEAVKNIDLLLQNCRRHLAPGGKILILESTVSQWFYTIEKFLFRVLNPIWCFPHPLVIQHTVAELLRSAQRCNLKVHECLTIPKGKWVLQFGLLFPAALTPAQPVKIVLSLSESLLQTEATASTISQ